MECLRAARAPVWYRTATDRAVVTRAAVTAICVGAILTVATRGAELLSGALPPAAAWQIPLSFVVPYLVSTLTSVITIGRHRAAVDRDLLLEREIEAILKFPAQNPHPVLRTSMQGRLLYANPASAPITEALGVAVGDDLTPETFAALLAGARSDPPAPIEIASGWRTFSLLGVDVPQLDVLNVYGTDVTASKVVEKFPDRNPNPVLRMSPAGGLIYANPSSAVITRSLGLEVGDPLPTELRDAIRRRLSGESDEAIEVRGEGRIFAITPVVVREFGFTNLYGTEITGLRAIDKFPNENPNPVLRVSRDGVLTYANPASALVRSALGAEVGDKLDAQQWARLQAAAASGPNVIEVESEGRLFALKVVSLPEFASINIYGTDVTAAREVEVANAENERLLLNILPKSVADRLRGGEVVIADRFEEMAVLFADVVNFTPFASSLSAAEVVQVLNGVFSVFDRLAERYGLEKIKTIGDAYMVVGGLDREPDGVERVAQMGLEMIEDLAGSRADTTTPLEIRVGMHVGPAIAGVIGLKKFIYDVWGDTVNTASRMESHGVPGRVQVSEATYERLKGSFAFEPRGTVEVKGKGAMSTYLLLGPRGGPGVAHEAAERMGLQPSEVAAGSGDPGG